MATAWNNGCRVTLQSSKFERQALEVQIMSSHNNAIMCDGRTGAWNFSELRRRGLVLLAVMQEAMVWTGHDSGDR